MSDKLENYKRYRADAWAFLTECVFTLDQVDKENPIKLFPDKNYLRYFVKVWQRYPLLAVPKSRRMTMSWTEISLIVWDTIFNKGRNWAMVSKKEDDANELVMRAKFIIDNIDRNKLPKELLPKYQHKFCVLNFPELHSKIQGFPQGADQLRQFTFSGIFGDESAFWEQAQEFYSASFPTIDGGGKMHLISSPAPGFFKKLVFDQLDAVGDVNVMEMTPDFIKPQTGVRLWKNPKNQFLVFELHYTADPLKRSDEYRETIKNSLPLVEYLREYELHWDTFQGMPVFPEFSKIHIAEEKPEPMPGLPMLLGFDFGLTPAAVVGQLQDEILVIFKEFIEINMGADRFADKVMAELRLRYPTFSDFKKNWLTYIDPSGVFRKDTDETTCAQILNAKGFRCIPGPVTWEERRHGVLHWLRRLSTSGVPTFRIYGRDCPMLVKGFEGGYRFAEKAAEIEPSKLRPVKDQFSHPHDALQYLCCGIKALNRKVTQQIPRPYYSVNQEEAQPNGARRWLEAQVS
jgi:hypothetical protein